MALSPLFPLQCQTRPQVVHSARRSPVVGKIYWFTPAHATGFWRCYLQKPPSAGVDPEFGVSTATLLDCFEPLDDYHYSNVRDASAPAANVEVEA